MVHNFTPSKGYFNTNNSIFYYVSFANFFRINNNSTFHLRQRRIQIQNVGWTIFAYEELNICSHRSILSWTTTWKFLHHTKTIRNHLIMCMEKLASGISLLPKCDWLQRFHLYIFWEAESLFIFHLNILHEVLPKYKRWI